MQKNRRGEHARTWTRDFVFWRIVVYFWTIRFLALSQIGIYWYEYTLGKFWQKNEHSTPPRETTRARAGSPPAESGETSMVRHVEQTPHRTVDLISSYQVERLRLKAWSKSDFSIAETTWPTYLPGIHILMISWSWFIISSDQIIISYRVIIPWCHNTGIMVLRACSTSPYPKHFLNFRFSLFTLYTSSPGYYTMPSCLVWWCGRPML